MAVYCRSTGRFDVEKTYCSVVRIQESLKGKRLVGYGNLRCGSVGTKKTASHVRMRHK